MSHADLLVGAAAPAPLSEFATRFFKTIGVSKFELRDSDNFVDGHYFIAKSATRTIQVMLSDDRDHSDRPYWIHVYTTGNAHLLAVAYIDAIAAKLVYEGYKVARIYDFGRINERRFEYVDKHEV